MNQNVQPHTLLGYLHLMASFSASAFMVGRRRLFPAASILWEKKGYLSMGLVMLVQSCVILTDRRGHARERQAGGIADRGLQGRTPLMDFSKAA